jgi:predicted ATP-grasp superfamily ATP-dependent carboligase
VFGIDFMLRQGNAWFLEVNPRLTASHMLYENVAPERQTSPSLITRHLAALGWKAAKAPVNSRSRRRPEDWHAIQARFILWAPEDFSVPENFATAFESDHSLRLADVPPSRTTVPAGSPLCSLHASATSVTLLAERIHSLPTTSSLSPLFSGPDIAHQVRHLFERYERNLVR